MGHNNAMPQMGFVCSTSAVTSLDNGLTPSARLSNPFPNGFAALQELGWPVHKSRTSVYILDRNARQPTSKAGTSISATLPGDAIVEVAYSGSHGVHLWEFWNGINCRPNIFN